MEEEEVVDDERENVTLPLVVFLEQQGSETSHIYNIGIHEGETKQSIQRSRMLKSNM